MARVKRAVHSKKHRRAVLEQAQGYFGNKSRSYRAAHEQVMHSLQYAFRDRRARKGDFRQLWIQRINAARPRPRDELQPAHRRAAGRRGRGRPQDPRRPGRDATTPPSPPWSTSPGTRWRGHVGRAPSRPPPDRLGPHRSLSRARLPQRGGAAPAAPRSSAARARQARGALRGGGRQAARRGPRGRRRGRGGVPRRRRGQAAARSDLAAGLRGDRAPGCSSSSRASSPGCATRSPRSRCGHRRPRSTSPSADLREPPARLVVVCVEVRDPGNAGTVLRAAGGGGSRGGGLLRRLGRRVQPEDGAGVGRSRCSTCRWSAGGDAGRGARRAGRLGPAPLGDRRPRRARLHRGRPGRAGRPGARQRGPRSAARPDRTGSTAR